MQTFLQAFHNQSCDIPEFHCRAKNARRVSQEKKPWASRYRVTRHEYEIIDYLNLPLSSIGARTVARAPTPTRPSDSAIVVTCCDFLSFHAQTRQALNTNELTTHVNDNDDKRPPPPNRHINDLQQQK